MEINQNNSVGSMRVVDRVGRIVIPQEFRKEFNIETGDTVEVFAIKNEGLFIKKHERKF